MTGALLVIANDDRWQYTYRSGRLDSVQSPSGRILEYSYNGSLLSQITLRDPASGSVRVLVTLARQTNGRIIEAEICGSKHRFTYEDGRDGKLVAWQRPGTTKPDTFRYDKEGVLATVLPGVGLEVAFKTPFTPALDEKGHPKNPGEKKTPEKSQLADDGTFKYTYTKTGVTVEDRAGGRQSLDFAANRGILSASDAAGREMKTYYYRAPGQKYDGKLRRVEQDGVVQIENRYDRATGNLTESKDRNGIITFYQYPPAPETSTVEANRLLLSKPIRITRGTRKQQETVATFKYDGAGRVLEQSDAGGRGTKLTYNARGELETVVEPGGTRITAVYDPYGRVIDTAAGDLHQKVEYDANGRIARRISPDGQTTEFGYDAQGNVDKLKQNGLAVSTAIRDPDNRYTVRFDALHRPAWSEFDTRGNLVADHQSNGSCTWYGYDAAGRRTSQIDGDGNKISFEYDAAGHLTKQTNPLGQALTWSYDEKGRLSGRTNGVQSITHTYDDKGRLAAILYSDSASGSARPARAASGDPAEASSKVAQKITYEYDDAGRLKKTSTPPTASRSSTTNLAGSSPSNSPVPTVNESSATPIMPGTKKPPSSSRVGWASRLPVRASRPNPPLSNTLCFSRPSTSTLLLAN